MSDINDVKREEELIRDLYTKIIDEIDQTKDFPVFGKSTGE